MTLGPLRPLRPCTVGYRWTKSCKGFTGKLTIRLPIFTEKTLLWSDNDNNMYLGSVVAAQQVLDRSPRHPHLREEKKGGHTSCNQVFRSHSRYQLPIQMLPVRSFYILICIIYSIILCTSISFSDDNVMRFRPRAVF